MAEGPKTISQLMADPALTPLDQQVVFRVLLVRVTRGSVQAALHGPDDGQAAQRFNRTTLSHPVAMEAQTLASPSLAMASRFRALT